MEWQPISTAPKDGTSILVGKEYRGAIHGCAVIRWGDENAADSEWGTVPHNENFMWLIDDGKNDPFHYRGWVYLTHWMPLP